MNSRVGLTTVKMPSLHITCLHIFILLLSITWRNESPNFLVQSKKSQDFGSDPSSRLSATNVNTEAAWRAVDFRDNDSETLIRVKRYSAGDKVDIANDTDKIRISLQTSTEKIDARKHVEMSGANSIGGKKQPAKVDTNSQQKKKKFLKADHRKKSALRSKPSRLLRTNNGQCEYIKGPWQECQRNGIQQRVLKLAKSSQPPTPVKNNNLQQQLTSAKHISANETDYKPTAITNNSTQQQSVRCDPVRVIRRECNTGCKYLRGQWSSKCVNGQRLRIDTLIGPRWRRQHQIHTLNDPNSNNSIKAHGNNPHQQQQLPIITCQPQRKVIKDCKRTCHYIKSDWSDCANGFKRRTLTLDEGPLENLNSATTSKSKNSQLLDESIEASSSKVSKTGLGCVKSKTIRRTCSIRQTLAHPKTSQSMPNSKTLDFPAEKANTTARKPHNETR